MNIYEVLFPNHTTLLFSTKSDITQFIREFSSARGIKTNSGAIYNPKQYISIAQVNTMDERRSRIVRPLSEVIIE